jgi:hypothetical protein
MQKLFLIALFVIAISTILFGQVSWKKSSGIDNLGINTFFKVNNLCYAGTVDSGIYISFDNGISFKTLNDGIIETGPLKTVNSFTQNNNLLYAAFGHALGGSIYSSENDGTTWIPTNFPTGATDIIAIDSVICASTGSGNYLFGRSTDWGENWEITPYPFNKYRYNFKISNDSIYATSNSEGLLFSNNLGVSWQTIGFDGEFCSDYLIHSGVIVLANTNGIFLSSNNGSNWMAANTDGLLNDASKISKFTSANDTIFAASNNAVYYSVLFGNELSNWTKISLNGLPNFDSDNVISNIHYSNGVLLIGTIDLSVSGTSSPKKGKGVWCYSSPDVSDIEQESIDRGILISPNPAGDIIYINSYSDAISSIEINSIDGRFLQKSALQSNKIQIDIAHFKPGIYIVSVKNGKGFVIKKLIKQ